MQCCVFGEFSTKQSLYTLCDSTCKPRTLCKPWAKPLTYIGLYISSRHKIYTLRRPISHVHTYTEHKALNGRITHKVQDPWGGGTVPAVRIQFSRRNIGFLSCGLPWVYRSRRPIYSLHCSSYFWLTTFKVI